MVIGTGRLPVSDDAAAPSDSQKAIREKDVTFLQRLRLRIDSRGHIFAKFMQNLSVI